MHVQATHDQMIRQRISIETPSHSQQKPASRTPSIATAQPLARVPSVVHVSSVENHMPIAANNASRSHILVDPNPPIGSAASTIDVFSAVSIDVISSALTETVAPKIECSCCCVEMERDEVSLGIELLYSIPQFAILLSHTPSTRRCHVR